MSHELKGEEGLQAFYLSLPFRIFTRELELTTSHSHTHTLPGEVCLDLSGPL